MNLTTLSLALATAVLTLTTSAQAQTRGGPAPRTPPLVVVPGALTARLGPQATPRAVAPPTLRQPRALPPIPRLSSAERAGLVQQAMNLPGPANLGPAIHLSVDAPVAPGGGDLSFTGGAVWSRLNLALFLPAQDSGANAGVQIDVPDSWSGPVAYDCAITSDANFFEWQTRSGSQWIGGQVQLWDRLVFVVPNLAPGGEVLLRTKPGAFGDYSWTFRWCDIAQVLS